MLRRTGACRIGARWPPPPPHLPTRALGGSLQLFWGAKILSAALRFLQKPKAPRSGGAVEKDTKRA